MSCGECTPSEGLAQLPLVFQGAEEGSGPSEHILLDGCITHESARVGSLCVFGKPEVREEGEMELGFRSEPALVFPQVV